jgi:ABC-2 type transport system permease protein
VRSRAFLIGTGVQIAIVIAIVVVASITSGDDTENFDVGTVGAEATAIVDAATAAQGDFDIELSAEALDDAAAARAEIADDELDAALADNTLFAPADPSEELVALLQSAAREVHGSETLSQAGVDDARIERALNPPALTVTEVGDGSGGEGLAWIGALLLYITIFSFGVAVAMGVVEEKSTRVVEVILSAIRPVQLLAGKVLGLGVVGLGQVLATVVMGLLAATALGGVDLPDSTGETAILVGVYFALGYLLYACAFAAGGALVSRQEDVGNSTSPLMVVLIGSYLASFSAIGNPDSQLAVILTFVPLSAPMVAPARAAQDGLPAWELALSLALMAVATVALIWLAARIYERAVLRMGAPLRLGQALRLLRAPAR